MRAPAQRPVRPQAGGLRGELKRLVWGKASPVRGGPAPDRGGPHQRRAGDIIRCTTT
ncbi:MAG: hypothetical protein V8S34_07100 [Lawsonibacter sp.]